MSKGANPSFDKLRMTKPVGIPVATFRWHPGYASLLGFALLAAYHGWKLGGPQILTDSPRYLHLARPDAPDGARRTPLTLLSNLPECTRHCSGDH